jgi:hypothetical protein
VSGDDQDLIVVLAGISILGIIAVALLHPDWRLLNWWPLVPHHGDYDMIQITPMRPNLTYQNHFDGALAGPGLSLILISVAPIKDAWSATQKRIDTLDVMNDCYAGIPRPDNLYRREA